MAIKLTLYYTVLSLLCMAAIGTRDDRRCVDKLEGPLDEFNNSRHVLHLEANQNNSYTVLIVCRITCQDAEATYKPELRIVNTDNGDFYQNRWHEASHLFNITIPISNDEFSCDPNDNVTDYEYLVTVLSPSFNRSVAICGLHYISSDNLHSEFCFTDRLALITIPETNNPSTTTSDDLTTTTASEGPTNTTASEGPTNTTGPITTTASIIVSPIRQASTIAPIVVAVVVGLGVVLGLLLVVLWWYKTRKRWGRVGYSRDDVEQLIPIATQDIYSESDASARVENDAHGSQRETVPTKQDNANTPPTKQDIAWTSESQDETTGPRKHSGLVTMESVNADDGNT